MENMLAKEQLDNGIVHALKEANTAAGILIMQSILKENI